MNTSTHFVFRPRFPWISLALGVWLVSRGIMFFGVLLLCMAGLKAWRWYRGPVSVPRPYFHLRRGGYAGGFRHQQAAEPEQARPSAAARRGDDDSRIEAAEWRSASVES